MLPNLIKLCGLRTRDDLESAITLGADYAGFVHHPASPRHLLLAEIQQLAALAAGRIHTAAVTVDADDALLSTLVEAGVTHLQLHGNESPKRVAEVKRAFGLPVIKALSVRNEADLAATADYHDADLLLFDAKPPPGGLPGGNGLSFDWRLLHALHLPRAWLLSGGLTPENVAIAVQQSGARGLDVSSGIESAPGIKSKQRMQAFMQAARKAMEA